MRHNDVQEIIACLGNDRTVFHYFKDRYCFDLIEFYMDRLGKDSLTINELKTSKLNRFTSKLLVKKALKSCGNGRLERGDLQTFWPTEILPFVLTLNGWGEGDRGWDQTSRNQCNLVLQLNFNGFHTKEYCRLMRPFDANSDEEGPFEYWGHPVCRQQRKTMSWVRMDVDFSTNEVLIEEIQNDWLRNAMSFFHYVQKQRKDSPELEPCQVNSGINGNYDDVEYYIDQVLAPYQAMWAEASMTAALQFIRRELGISTVYYHSFDTGRKIKAVCGLPPRSMYTQLPKQFGFELTGDHPEFLMQDKVSRRYIKSIKNPCWFRLAA